MKVRLKHIASVRYGKVMLLVQPEGESSTYSAIVTLPQEYQAVRCTCCKGYHYPSTDGFEFPKLNSLITLSDSVQLTPLGE
jgi:hypothetical protein